MSVGLKMNQKNDLISENITQIGLDIDRVMSLENRNSETLQANIAKCGFECHWRMRCR